MNRKIRQIKAASKMKKIKTYADSPKQRRWQKNLLPYYIMGSVVSWTWTYMPNSTASLISHLLLLSFFLLGCRAIYILYIRVDPIGDTINDLEQQFWDRQYKKDTDPQM